MITLEQARKWVTLILIVVAGVLAYLAIRSLRRAAAYEAERAAFEDKLRTAETEISRYKSEADASHKIALEARREADLARQAEADVKNALHRSEAERAIAQARIATMTASNVVLELRTRLKMADAEIQETRAGIVFSLAAGRRGLSRIVDADEFEFSLIPQYKKLIDLKTQENEKLRVAIAAQDSENLALRGAITQYDKLKIDYANILKKSESQARLLKWTIGGGVIVVSIAGLLLLIGSAK